MNDRGSSISSVFAVVVVMSALTACGGGYSTQEAYARCEEERTVKVTLTDESFAECVACYENCGSECEAAGTSPETYSCPE